TGQCPVPHHSSPVHTDHDRVRLYTPEFAADPHRAYRDMRERYGSMVPVELAPGVPATLVVGYRVAVRILHDPDHFPADPRGWQRHIDPGCPVLPILSWRPNALRSAGAEHDRYRRAAIAGIDGVDLHRLHDVVERIATALIDTFSGNGSADLLRDYAAPLAFEAINALLGCPPEIGNEIAAATAAIFEGVDTGQADLRLAAAILRLIERKRAEPGADITTRLIAHPAGFTDEELIHQLGILYGAGTEPTLNLITNSLLLMVTDQRFAGSLLDGGLSTRNAPDGGRHHPPAMASLSRPQPLQRHLSTSADPHRQHLAARRSAGGGRARGLQQRPRDRRGPGHRQPLAPGVGCGPACLPGQERGLSDRPGRRRPAARRAARAAP